MPDAVTKKVAVWPTETDWLAGWVMILAAAGLPVPVVVLPGLTMPAQPATKIVARTMARNGAVEAVGVRSTRCTPVKFAGLWLA